MINENIYQLIFDELSNFLPDLWEKLVVRLDHDVDYYSYSFFVKKCGEYIKCYDLENVSEDVLFDSFSKIEEAVSAARDEFSENTWFNMTMVVESNGKMKTEFDYTDFSDNSYQYNLDWKAKYLI